MMKPENLLLNLLQEKAILKKNIYDNTLAVFEMFKDILQDVISDYNKELKQIDKRILLDYRDRGIFEAEIKVAGDLLIFNMHTNVFQFDRSHNIWKTSYVADNEKNSYCGVINIYNFLADSFKYQRFEDLGYLIGRIYINQEKHFFLEGKRQLGFLYRDYGSSVIDPVFIRSIINSAILYSVDFDLLMPPYDDVKIVTVSQMEERISSSGVQTGKRLGFKFYADEDIA